MADISSDVYNISDMIYSIQKKHYSDVSDDTLSMGLLGYTNEVFTEDIQNSIILASEWGNEAFPTRSKFEKTILTNAITYNIDDINAVPAQMDIMLGFIEKEFVERMDRNVFVLDHNCELYVGSYVYHLDYDIIITREKSNTGEWIYTARYDIDGRNDISDIENPYIQPPIRLDLQNDTFLFITCKIRQVEYINIGKKIITNNILDNKTFEFEYEDQLASFRVFIQEGNKNIELIPIFDGMPLEGNEKYCYYSFLKKNTIRVKFDRNSYEPRTNCNVNVLVQTTKGSECNFEYKENSLVTLISENYNYKNLSCYIRPITNSQYGLDRKSKDVLKKLIPKEILSRGVITTDKDLENYFDTLDESRLLFYTKRDNQLSRLKYGYLIVKDNNNNVVPTNTLDLIVSEDQFENKVDNRYILNPGYRVVYDKNNNNGFVTNDDTYNEINTFVYSSPFICVVNEDPLSVSYYLNNVNKDYEFSFSFINKNSTLQFISTYINCERNYLDNEDYILTMNVTQNMALDQNIIELDKEGNIVNCKLKPILVLKSEKGFCYYLYGKVVEFSTSNYTAKIQFNIKTNNIINSENQLRVEDVYLGGTDSLVHTFLNDSIEASVYLLVDIESQNGRGDLDNIIPNLKGFVTNKYTTNNKLNLFYNYSNIMNSTVDIISTESGKYKFKIKGVPLIRYSYLNNIVRCNDIIDYIQYRKAYIDTTLNNLENSFSIDFKFFNTYGPSKQFIIGHNNTQLNRVNLSLNFKIKLKVSADANIIDSIILAIKDYIENLNSLTNIHISNLITKITNDFNSDVKFIEFFGINEYNALYQYLEKKELEDIDDVPEFININLKDSTTPDITITLA